MAKIHDMIRKQRKIRKRRELNYRSRLSLRRDHLDYKKEKQLIKEEGEVR